MLGQTPLKLARMLAESGVRIMGTQPEAIDLAEDRERFAAVLDRIPDWGRCTRQPLRRPSRSPGGDDPAGDGDLRGASNA